MNTDAENTRRKLPICERLLRLFKPETDAGELRTINDTIDTIEALYYAVIALLDALDARNRSEADEAWNAGRAALAKARNGGQP